MGDELAETMPDIFLGPVYDLRRYLPALDVFLRTPSFAHRADIGHCALVVLHRDENVEFGVLLVNDGHDGAVLCRYHRLAVFEMFRLMSGDELLGTIPVVAIGALVFKIVGVPLPGR
jgi:hypothetical protein